MTSENNFYFINITPETFITANHLAKIRNPYEFQRSGHLYNYDKTTYQMQTMQNMLMLTYPLELSRGNTAIGILSELLIFDDLTKHIQQKYQNLQNSFTPNIPSLQQFMVEQSCCYHLIIGSYDNGFDIQKNDIKIDIKCYGNKIIEDINQINNLNLLVDERQFSANKADIYIQTFILKDNNKLFLIVAGYAENSKLILNPHFQNPAYCRCVSELLPYKHFKEKYF